jgi:hypothetical protein
MCDELKHELMEIKRKQDFLLLILKPDVWTVPMIAKITNRTPQAVRDWLTKNAEPDIGYKKKNGKIIVSEEVALTYINERR